MRLGDDEYSMGAPDLPVEVLSPSVDEITEKMFILHNEWMRQFLRIGVDPVLPPWSGCASGRDF
jgi:hypothetical protein